VSQPSEALDGILLVDKEPGWTSHDVVGKLRGLAGQRRIGHTGTLDPGASGLLLVCLGRATRLIEYMAGHDKRYEGEIRLGVNTTTDDDEGEALREREVPQLAPEQLAELETRFSGTLWQVPPAYSAVKLGGVRAYAIARAGRQPEVRAREVHVHALRLEPRADNVLWATVDCGAGTYIRSLARDIGEALECGAHLAGLRRTAVGPYTIAQASSIAELARLAAAGMLQRAVVQGDEAIAALPAVLVAEGNARRLAQGATVTLAGAAAVAGKARVYSAVGEFIGVAKLAGDGALRCEKVVWRG
jgi:tRNA pseudouridine55 synthase